MSGRGIGALATPDTQFDVSLLALEIANFETEAAAAKEDRYRRRSLKRAKTLGTMKTGRLRRRIKAAETLASACAMRRERIKITGAIWELVHERGIDHVSTVTLMPFRWRIPADKLATIDPRKLTRQVRAELYRCGAAKASGFFVGFIHGQHEPQSDAIQLHMHAIVSGGMRDVVDRLRPRRNFQHRDANGRKLDVKGVVQSRQSLSNMPAPVTYVLQSFWPAKYRGDADGRPINQRYKARIVEPRHAEVLLWVDRWSVADLALTIGVRAGRHGLRVSG